MSSPLNLKHRSTQREEKQLESSLEDLIQRVREVKASVTALLLKLEHEYQTLNWPTMLDNFALVSGQINSLNRLMKNDKMPALRNQILLPVVLAPERDAELEKVTEGRVVAFNHEVVPDYLRTKLEPDVEEKIAQMQAKANSSTADMQKQINSLTKITNNVIEVINSTREEWENESQKATQPQTSSQADTNTLIAAISLGKSLRPARRPDSAGPPTVPQGPSSQPGPPGQLAPAGYPHQVHGYYGGAPGMPKAPSTIKTNIKSASNIHPYSRP